MARRNFKAVASAALAAAGAVLDRWLPGGKPSGHEYRALNPTRSDGRAGSFSVNTKTGAWSDFATGDKGGDLIALVAYLEGVNQAEAHDRLAAFLGLADRGTAAPASNPKTAPKARAASSDEVPVLPVPEDAPPPPRTHSKRGKPSALWTYRNADGAVLFYIARFDAPGGGKDVLPLALWRDEKETLRWRWKGVPAPRPLYALDRLASNPSATVLVTEGEKAADAAQALITPLGWVGTTTPGGARAADKADWSPLRGRHVRIWPDADAPGAGYADDVARRALAAGAASAQVLSLDALHGLHGGPLPDGWDAADAQAEGIAPEPLCAVLGASENWTAIGTKTKQGSAAGAPTGGKAPSAKVPVGFMLVPISSTSGRRPGVHYLPQVRDKASGEVIDAPPEWICSPLEVAALTRDAGGSDWGRLLVFPDRDGIEHRWAMPCAMLAKDGAEMRESLLSQGVEITLNPDRRRRLGEYIMAAEPGRFARCVARTGWHDDAFVTATSVIGQTRDEELVLQSATPGSSDMVEASTLEQWRDAVAAPCAGNSRLVLAICAALAAPCLALVGQEGGGLHFRGASSSGKSTALAVAASVYGPPAYVHQWRTTSNALESLAALHSDALLVLDELGQLEPQHAASVAYLLSNGQAKSRSHRDGSLRAPATWRVLFLSCGEVGLGDLIAEAGGRNRAGMEVRVTDIPADAGTGLGIFDAVPPETKPGAVADGLKAAAAEHHGTAFTAFLRALTGDMERSRAFLAQGTQALADELAAGDVAGQVRRVARRFGLIGAAGELATAHGITGWPRGEAEAAARRCFVDWLAARGGSGESEPRAMVAQVQSFIGLHGDGRFTDMNRVGDDRAPRTLVRAGWRTDESGGDEYWVLPEVWRNEVCKGFDPVAVAKVLAERNLLKPESPGKFTRRERLKNGERVRVYRLLPGLLEVEP